MAVENIRIVLAIGELSADNQNPVTSLVLAVWSKDCDRSHTSNEQVRTAESKVEAVCENSNVISLSSTRS